MFEVLNQGVDEINQTLDITRALWKHAFCHLHEKFVMHASIEILVQLHHLGLDQFITRRSIQARHQKWKLPHHFFKSST